jgi:hypothetical protein
MSAPRESLEEQLRQAGVSNYAYWTRRAKGLTHEQALTAPAGRTSSPGDRKLVIEAWAKAQTAIKKAMCRDGTT